MAAADIPTCTVAHSVIVNVFERADQTPQHSKVTHPAVKYMEEVVQTQKCITISSDKIKCIAFVFVPTKIQNSSYNAMQGMKNTFTLHFRHTGNIYALVPKEKCLPFPDLYDDYSLKTTSYACRIFHDYELIKTEMRRKLGRIAQSQGSSAKASITFHIAKETWNMLSSSIVLGLKRIVSFHRPKQILDQGLKVRSVLDGVDDADFI